MRLGRWSSLVAGSLLVVPGVALMTAGGAPGAGYPLNRGDDGYVSATIDRLESPHAPINAEKLSLATDPVVPTAASATVGAWGDDQSRCVCAGYLSSRGVH